MSNTFSEIKVFKVEGNKVVVARGSVLVSNTVIVNFTVMNGSNGRFVSLPAEKSDKVDENGKPKYFPHAKLKTRELNDELTRLVLEELDGKGSAPRTKASTGDGLPF